jgi:hypothetical protein
MQEGKDRLQWMMEGSKLDAEGPTRKRHGAGWIGYPYPLPQQELHLSLHLPRQYPADVSRLGRQLTVLQTEDLHDLQIDLQSTRRSLERSMLVVCG